MASTVMHAQQTAGGTTATSAETVVIFSDTLTLTPIGGLGYRIHGTINITAGTGTTAVVVKVRQGTTTSGTQVGATMTHTLAAAASGSISFDAIDFAAATTAVANYVVTVAQTSGSAAGTINQAVISVTPVSTAN